MCGLPVCACCLTWNGGEASGAITKIKTHTPYLNLHFSSPHKERESISFFCTGQGLERERDTILLTIRPGGSYARFLGCFFCSLLYARRLEVDDGVAWERQAFLWPEDKGSCPLLGCRWHVLSVDHAWTTCPFLFIFSACPSSFEAI